MNYVIVAGLGFLGGLAFSAGFYERELAIVRRLATAWKKGVPAFDREVAALEAQFQKLFRVRHSRYSRY